MWQQLAKFVIKNRIAVLIFLALFTGVMTYYAAQVKLSYEFSKAIPTNNQKYIDYMLFKQKFGDDGNLLVVGITTNNLFELKNFNLYQQLQTNLKKINGIEDILSVPLAINLVKNAETEKLIATRIFADTITTQAQLDSSKALFYSLPFYADRLYNTGTNSYLMAVRVNKALLATKERSAVIAQVETTLNDFKTQSGMELHASGLPLIRTILADRIKEEMKLFLLASLGLSVLILILFFRSVSTTILSLLVVLIGVVCTIGTTYLCGYQITLLTALIPSLVVVMAYQIVYILLINTILLMWPMLQTPTPQPVSTMHLWLW